MADLIAIGYDDEETALRAAEEVERLSQDLIIEPEAVAVIIRDQKGKYKVITNHHPVATGVTWGMFWGVLFGLLFFTPVFGLAVGGVFGALLGLIDTIGIDKEFQRHRRVLLALRSLGSVGFETVLGRILSTVSTRSAVGRAAQTMSGAASS